MRPTTPHTPVRCCTTNPSTCLLIVEYESPNGDLETRAASVCYRYGSPNGDGWMRNTMAIAGYCWLFLKSTPNASSPATCSPKAWNRQQWRKSRSSRARNLRHQRRAAVNDSVSIFKSSVTDFFAPVAVVTHHKVHGFVAEIQKLQ